MTDATHLNGKPPDQVKPPAGLQVPPAPAPVTYRIDSAFADRDPDELITIPLIEYLMHCHSARCAHCGRRERWSQIFEVRVVESPFSKATTRILRPVDPHSALDPLLALKFVCTKERTILRCGTCVLDQTTVSKQISQEEWQATLARKATALRAPSTLVAKPASANTSTKPKPAGARIEDL